jgi:NADH:ubiquinone oxidoreductase subunit K
MKDLTLQTLLAVFEEMFGPTLFWTMMALAGLVTLAYLIVLVRDRAVSWRKFLLAQLSMPVGAVAAVAFVFWITRSGLGDIGGAIDLIMVLGIAAAGAVGFAILVYTVQSLLQRPGRTG